MSDVAEHISIDMERINDATGGDEEFLRDLVEIFLEDTEVRVQEIKDAIAQADLLELKKCAHKLKGSSANMGAIAMWKLAEKLELYGEQNEGIDQAALCASNLDVEFERVSKELQTLIGEA